MRQKDEDKLQAFEMKCFRQSLNIQWQQKIRNEILVRIGMAQDIVQKVIEKRLNLLGNICGLPGNRLLKQVAFGRQGRMVKE